MRSSINAHGKTTIPAEVLRHFQLSAADCLEWVIENGTIRVVPVQENAIDAFRGSSKSKGSTDRLLADRAVDRERE